jgi:hypothetical protein
MKLFYNKDLDTDVKTVLAFLEGFSKALNENKKTSKGDISTIDISPSKFKVVMQCCYMDFPCIDGIDGSSIFKKAANFIVNFILEEPVINFSDEISNILSKDLLKIKNYQNSVTAFIIAAALLYKAKIYTENETKTIDSRLEISKHSFLDLIDYLSTPTLDQFPAADMPIRN